jgi:hypothetical protein
LGDFFREVADAEIQSICAGGARAGFGGGAAGPSKTFSYLQQPSAIFSADEK